MRKGQHLIPSATQLGEQLKHLDAPAEAVAAFERLCHDNCVSPLHALRTLWQNGQVNEVIYQQVVSTALSIPLHEEFRDDVQVSPAFIDRIPIRFARDHGVIALHGSEGIRLVLRDPLDAETIDTVVCTLGTSSSVEAAPSLQIERLIDLAYSTKQANYDKVISEAGDDAALAEALALDTDLLDDATRAPVIRLVNMILFEAAKKRASDVHLQPIREHLKVRFRIDGVLYDHVTVPITVAEEVISRIKVIGEMDIAEKRVAQDGRTAVRIGDRSIDLRISIIPTSHGERAVLRLLDKSSRLFRLSELGMSPRDEERFTDLLAHPNGIILVTGPTGSGKSTTLYAALQYLNTQESNILTLEDPIEYQLPGISQMQVATRKGMNFANGLRAVLRQDPDVIMVGEIRDEETARMAVQSSLTGHLVFSTLHTNDAAGSVTRLLDLKIEPYLVASSLLAVMAQRLVRILCPHCKRNVAPSGEERVQLQREAPADWNLVPQAIGCEECSQTGFSGRRGIFEILVVDEPMRELIVTCTKTSELRTAAIRNGMTTLRQDGLRKVKAGDTTLHEVSRVCYQDEVISHEAEQIETVAPALSPVG